MTSLKHCPPGYGIVIYWLESIHLISTLTRCIIPKRPILTWNCSSMPPGSFCSFRHLHRCCQRKCKRSLRRIALTKPELRQSHRVAIGLVRASSCYRSKSTTEVSHTHQDDSIQGWNKLAVASWLTTFTLQSWSSCDLLVLSFSYAADLPQTYHVVANLSWSISDAIQKDLRTWKSFFDVMCVQGWNKLQ